MKFNSSHVFSQLNSQVFHSIFTGFHPIVKHGQVARALESLLKMHQIQTPPKLLAGFFLVVLNSSPREHLLNLTGLPRPVGISYP